MSRNKEQNIKMREKKQELILKEAMKEFAMKGLFATKIKDIAENVGMAQGLLYHYYKSKEEIYIEIINNAFDKLIEASESLEAMNIPAHEKIRRSIIEILITIENSEEFNQTCRFIAQAINSTAIPSEAQRLILEKRSRPYQIIGKIMQEGQSEGTIVEGDPEQLAVLYWTAINGLAIYQVSNEGKIPMPDANLLINIFLRKGV